MQHLRFQGTYGRLVAPRESATEPATERYRFTGGHQPGYQQNRNRGKFAPGNGGEHAHENEGEGDGSARAVSSHAVEAAHAHSMGAARGRAEAEGAHGAPHGPRLEGRAAARRSALDSHLGAYSEAARVAHVDRLLTEHPELLRALHEHFSGGQQRLSVARVVDHAMRLESTPAGSKPSRVALARARSAVERLRTLSEWSLLHGAGDTPINADGMLTLYHGIHGQNLQGTIRSLSTGRHAEGKSFTSDQSYARQFADAYRQPGERAYVLRAEVPASAIVAHDGLFAGLKTYQHAAYEHEYVLGTGTKLHNVREA